MKITKMRKVDWGKTKALFTLITSEGIEIKDMKVVEGINGMFVAPPSVKGKDDNYYNTLWIPKELQPQLNELAQNAFDPVGDTIGDDIPF